jgi:predicted acetyltransferase
LLVQSGDKRYHHDEPSNVDACRLLAYPLYGSTVMPSNFRFEHLDRIHEASLLELAEEFREEGDHRFDGLLDDPDAYFELADRFVHDRDLPPNRVPMTHYLLFDGELLVGGSRLRRRLIPVLLLDGGNIGYEVRRSARRRGYATEILKRTLEEARVLGLDRVLLTTEVSNAGSSRVIERAGGVPDGKTVSPRTGEQMRRYWIAL